MLTLQHLKGVRHPPRHPPLPVYSFFWREERGEGTRALRSEAPAAPAGPSSRARGRGAAPLAVASRGLRPAPPGEWVPLQPCAGVTEPRTRGGGGLAVRPRRASLGCGVRGRAQELLRNRVESLGGVHGQDEGSPRPRGSPRSGPPDAESTPPARRPSPRRARGSRGHTGMRPWLGVAILGHRRCVWARRRRAAASGSSAQTRARLARPRAERARDLARRQRVSVAAARRARGCASPRVVGESEGLGLSGATTGTWHTVSPSEGAVSPSQPPVSSPRTPMPSSREARASRAAHSRTWVPGLRGRFFIQKER